MSKASDIVKIALAEVGYKEKESNYNLDSPSANAGDDNYTKYARDLAAAGYYNGNKNGFAWCDVFVDWCFFKAYGKTEGQRIQCQTGDLGAGCKYSMQYYQNQGRLSRIPQVGDQVFFQQNGSIVHTGLVVEVTASNIVTVEGNSGNQVKKHTYKRSSSYISAYGHPAYSETDGLTASSSAAATEEKEIVGKAITLELNELKKGCSGDQVKGVQRPLFSMGFKGADGKPLEVDGKWGANTDYAFRAWQKKTWPNKPEEHDGICGIKGFSALYKGVIL